MEDKILESIAYILPAAVTGFVAYYMFNGFLKQQNTEKKLALMAEKKKESLPIKLQAYERMLLFCERINPVKMLVRIKPISENTSDYLKLLIANIDQEFEHNLVQQIYISDEVWTAIIATKRAIINKLQQSAETANSANDFRENVLIDYSKTLPPTETAISFIKNEVKKLL
ncbi:hypothetical protein BW723_13360 [Polaribacter reichenbachii]|uniref:Uncharacterized protein n=1 Tax=Polaribacter reichenbachii TaxID=996801 RepID=A0A1B8U1A8_9FLAO|nr:hypothetical protein [Polaribacter reichenbachii]APZ47210.1 hypothetical protein BW723_13360 [Polaribacter reichenbachii]AUC17851.1 hypothetical protein BTO17_03815 [Polaribacter reichenbachii]OBY65658.1 hypothetical protein LPB301_08420 [Polaribacter reichenbachii]